MELYGSKGRCGALETPTGNRLPEGFLQHKGEKDEALENSISEASVPISVNIPVTSLYGIVYLCDR